MLFFCRWDCRRGTSSMCDLRARAPMLHQWHRVQGRLARSQWWHHQLWQFSVCHADSVSVYHHGGLDRRAVLGKSHSFALAPMQFSNLWLTHAFSFTVSSNLAPNSNVTDNVMMKLLINSRGCSYHSDMIDCRNDATHSSTLLIKCSCSVTNSILARSLFFLKGTMTHHFFKYIYIEIFRSTLALTIWIWYLKDCLFLHEKSSNLQCIIDFKS